MTSTPLVSITEAEVHLIVGELVMQRLAHATSIAPGELHTGHATSEDGWIYRNPYIEPI
jgi:hypothetical protein